MSSDEVFNQRKNKFLRIGRSKGFMNNLDNLSSLKKPYNELDQILKSKKIIISIILLGLIALISLILFL